MPVKKNSEAVETKPVTIQPQINPEAQLKPEAFDIAPKETNVEVMLL